jgi:excisionase family DNA binding protein
MAERPPDELRVDTLWMTIAQVAAYLSVSPGTVRNWVSQRRVPFARRGRVVRFHKDRIDQWLSARSARRRPVSKPSPARPIPNGTAAEA